MEIIKTIIKEHIDKLEQCDIVSYVNLRATTIHLYAVTNIVRRRNGGWTISLIDCFANIATTNPSQKKLITYKIHYDEDDFNIVDRYIKLILKTNSKEKITLKNILKTYEIK